MKSRVYFKNSQKQYAVGRPVRDLLRMAIGAALSRCAERAPRLCEVSVTFTDNIGIAALNAEYRGRNGPTDVLSFPMFEPEELPPPDTGEYEALGDIVISCEKASEQAAELGHSFERELAFLAVHSTLHLMGFDHERSEKADEEMCAHQREIMSNIADKVTN